MKRFILALSIILLLFVGYQFFRSDLTPEDKLTIKIADETAEKLKTKIPSLHLGAWGGRATVVYMGFQINHEIDLESGRDLILQISNSYLEAFNSNKKFRSFIDYSFTIKNLHIDLFFSNPDRSSISPGKIAVIFINDGVVGYDIHDPEDRLPDGHYRLLTIHEETYQEAMQASSHSESLLIPLVIEKSVLPASDSLRWSQVPRPKIAKAKLITSGC